MARRSLVKLGMVSLIALGALLVGASLGAPTPSAARAAGEAAVIDARVRLDASLARRRSGPITLPIRANLLGATWHASARPIELRTRTRGGRWSAWLELSPSSDGPDPGSREARTGSQSAAPVWVGAADEVELRHPARARGAELVLVNSVGDRGRSASPRGRAQRLLGATRLVRVDAAHAAPYVSGGIMSRARWLAAPPRLEPQIAERAQGIVVHHTVSTNSYTCASVPSMLRAIQRYHMRANGWNDIGYNFLIDRCGRVWEGRAGGMTRAVIGAHSAGFNTGTVGVAYLGTHTSRPPTRAAQRSMEHLIAWRMDIAHVLPGATMRLTARSSDKFRTGQLVSARSISGHRDLFPTACPGAVSYRGLGALTRRARAFGGLKVGNVTSAPRIDARSGELSSVVVRAVATSARAQLRVALERASSGEVLAERQITGAVVRLSSTMSSSVPAWDVRVRVSAQLGSQRARTYLEPLVPRYGEAPGFEVVSDPDARVALGGSDALVQLGYRLRRTDARVGAWLYDPERGVQLRELVVRDGVFTDVADQRIAQITIPADVSAGTYELRVGVASDPAPGRSIRRFVLEVTP